MNIRIRNSSNDPIYLQIKDQIKNEILNGSIQEGEMLPSIRLLAKELRVSVITTKRAYDELEQEGFLHSVQGKGSFVAPQNRELLREQYLKKVEVSLGEALDAARTAGITLNEVKDMLDLLDEERK